MSYWQRGHFEWPLDFQLSRQLSLYLVTEPQSIPEHLLFIYQSKWEQGEILTGGLVVGMKTSRHTKQESSSSLAVWLVKSVDFEFEFI